MTIGSSSQKYVSRDKSVMHEQRNYLNIDAYNEFIQRQSYVDDTQNNLSLIIFEPTSTNIMESQSQNIPSHIEIPDDGDDQDTIDTQDTRKKFDLFEVHMKKLTKSNETIIVVCNYCSKEFK